MDGTSSLPRKHQSLHYTYLYTERKWQYFDLAALEHKRNTTWIQNNIKRRECVRYVQNKDDSGSDTCECGEIRSRHPELPPSRDEGDDTTEGEWTITKDTKLFPTNAFGEIEFVGPGSGFGLKTRKFIRCDYNTDPKVLLTLVSTEWKLGAPKLLISVMGGNRNFKLRGRLKEVFCKGIMDAAVSSGAWIISAGTHSGVMKYVGEAVRDYQMMRRYEEVTAIGIITWGTLKQQRQLIADKGKYPANLSTRKNNDKNGVFLDPNHTHFILVDDGTKGKFGAGLSLRVKLEEMISTKVKVGSSNTHVPVVCVILEGGPSTLRKAHSAVTHGTPIVVVANSGRVADVLSLAIKQSQQEGEHRKMDATLRAKIAQMLRQISTNGNGDVSSDVMLQHVEDCLKCPHLLNVYEESSGVPMDVAVLSALMRGHHRQQQDYLRLAQAWNRIDIARTDLLDASSKDSEMKEDEVHELFRDALIHNRVDFIKLYLENGFNLKDYLTHAELTYLYNQIKRGTLLYSLLAKVSPKQKGRQRWFSLADVGKVIRSLTMDRYKAPYQDLEDNQKERRKSKDLTQDMQDLSQKVSSPRFKDPVRELFLYAVLNTYDEMSHFLWEEGKETMAAALAASSIYQNMAARLSLRDAELKMQLKSLSKKYSKLAIAVLDQCNRDDEQWSSILLLRDLPHWGHVTAISLAGENLHFINRNGVQDLVKEIWYGELSSEGNPSLLLWLCTLIPPLIPFLVSFRPTNASIIQPHQHVITSSTKRHSNAGFLENELEMKARRISRDDSWEERRPRAESIIPLKSDSDGAGRNDLAIWQMILYFYNSPMIIFRHNVVSHLVFLGLFSYIMLSDNFKTTEPPWYEYLLMVWVATFLAEEFRQVAHGDAQKWRLRLKEWFSDYWNQLDFATLVLFGIGTAMRFNTGLLNAARVVLAFDLFIFYMRLLNSFTIYQQLGPKLIMIGKMFMDVLFFVCILFVFLIAYGITLQAILYPTITDVESLIYGVLYRPYFQIYGELFLDDIKGTPGDTCTHNRTEITEALPICPEYSGIGVFLLAIYMIFSNVLLLNLLIAMFSFTLSAVQERTDMYWKYQQFALAKEYYNRPPLVPPLVIISHIVFIIRFLLYKIGCCYYWHTKTLTKHLEPQDVAHLVHWESVQAYKIISKLKLNQKLDDFDLDDDDNSSQISHERSEWILQSFQELSRQQSSLSSRLKRLEDQMDQNSSSIAWMLSSVQNKN